MTFLELLGQPLVTVEEFVDERRSLFEFDYPKVAAQYIGHSNV